MGRPAYGKGIYRRYDSSVIQLISAWPKVVEIVEGRIPIPEVAEIFLTSFCNFACPHCRFKGYHEGSGAYMEEELLEGLLDELGSRGVKTIELSGGGEGLEHPRIEKIFDLFIKDGFRVGVITNGYRFTVSGALREKAARCCDWIRFSLDAFSDGTFKRIHGRGDISYGELGKAISALRAMPGKGPRIGLKMLISKLNWEDCGIAVEEALRLKAHYLQFKFLGSPAEFTLPDTKADELAKKLAKDIEAAGDHQLVAEIIPPYRGRPAHKKCLMTFLHPVIDWDGEIYVCAFFEHRKGWHSLGNVKDCGFFRHWDSGHHKEVFEAIDPETCVPNCPMLRYNPVIDFIKNDHYRFSYI